MLRATLTAFAVFAVCAAIGVAMLVFAPSPWNLITPIASICAGLVIAVAVDRHLAAPRNKEEAMEERAEEIPS